MSNNPSLPGFTQYDSDKALSNDDLELLNAAKAAALNSYAPYSQYQVGAALRLENGEIFTGNNQENAAYPSGLCAERVALYYAQSQFPDLAVESIAITAHTDKFLIDEAVAPCGSCRQVMSEYEDRHGTPMRVIMGGETGKILVAESMDYLLPIKFTAENLKSK